ncbi:Hypothetical predicted protein [Pelobates cultripes]|uniref:Uncharacterized protein n=1 Tax=Pelobates cultripes TaxID=61616 RepID=A0AAD1S3P8_PELCU|nr:Hypothetical predicted protein [Pelobates cultripes]
MSVSNYNLDVCGTPKKTGRKSLKTGSLCQVIKYSVVFFSKKSSPVAWPLSVQPRANYKQTPIHFHLNIVQLFFAEQSHRPNNISSITLCLAADCYSEQQRHNTRISRLSKPELDRDQRHFLTKIRQEFSYAMDYGITRLRPFQLNKGAV